MSKPAISAIELFNRFAPKFSAVTWKPLGFQLGKRTARFEFRPDNRSYSSHEYPYFDLKEASFPFSFTYDPCGEDPNFQMLHACWAAILTGPFAGRSFYAYPLPSAIEKYFTNLAERRVAEHIPFHFWNYGDEIPGLSLGAAMTASCWTFFIPHNSPEGVAIEAAVALDFEAFRRQKSEEIIAGANIEALQVSLRSALEAVPA